MYIKNKLSHIISNSTRFKFSRIENILHRSQSPPHTTASNSECSSFLEGCLFSAPPRCPLFFHIFSMQCVLTLCSCAELQDVPQSYRAATAQGRTKTEEENYSWIFVFIARQRRSPEADRSTPLKPLEMQLFKQSDCHVPSNTSTMLSTLARGCK